MNHQASTSTSTIYEDDDARTPRKPRRQYLMVCMDIVVALAGLDAVVKMSKSDLE